jgi:hypothetical protein
MKKVERVFKIRYPTAADFQHQPTAVQPDNESNCVKGKTPDLKNADKLAALLWDAD